MHDADLRMLLEVVMQELRNRQGGGRFTGDAHPRAVPGARDLVPPQGTELELPTSEEMIPYLLHELNPTTYSALGQPSLSPERQEDIVREPHPYSPDSLEQGAWMERGI